MFAKKAFLPFLLLFNALPLFAQVDDLLKNKDINWVAEITTDLILDNPDSAVEKQLNRIRTLKLLPNQKVSGGDDRFEFSYIIHNLIKADKIPFFADSGCQKRVFMKDISILDTALCSGIEPNFYTIKEHIILSFYQPEEFNVFRVRQIVYYNAKKVQFGLRTLAFAPLVNHYCRDGDSFDLKPVCWIKAEDIEKRPKLSSNDIIWARTFATYKGFDIKKAKILKQTSDDMPMLHFLNAAEKDSNKFFFSGESFFGMQKISYANINLLFQTRRDTISDISGFYGSILETPFDKSAIKNLRLVQEWFWDERKQKLSIRFVAVAPMKDITNEAGEHMYWQPLFYRRVDTN
jgi:hypothetical protein